MERRAKKESLLERTAEVFDLPGDLVAGLPRVEITGSRELRMENHKGILAYGPEEIHVSGGKLLQPGAPGHERRRAPHHRGDRRAGPHVAGWGHAQAD